jgi:dolichol kinase
VSADAPLGWRAEALRKALHAGTAVLPVAWAQGWIDTASLRALLSAAAVAALAVESLRSRPGVVRRAFTQALAPLLRAHEARRLTGATWLALAMCAVAWLVPGHAATAALWAAAVGDASAAVVGRAAAARGLAVAGRKSWAGSVAALTTTAAGVWWLTPAAPLVAVALGAVAAAAERPRGPVDDNLRIALAVAAAATALGLR